MTTSVASLQRSAPKARRALGLIIAGLIGAISLHGLLPTAHAAGKKPTVRSVLPRSFPLSNGQTAMRIVNGTMAQAGAWPSMVGLYKRDALEGRTPVCGAAIIDLQWVVTAAHCVYNQKPDLYFIREAANAVGAGSAVDVREIIAHEGYSPETHVNDIALLRLTAPAQSPRQKLLRDSMRSTMLKEGQIATIIGFGLVQAQSGVGPHTGSASERLLQADIPLISSEKCAQVYGADRITEATLCAGLEAGGTDSCSGDSGGPLFLRDRLAQPIQVGVVSWGDGCAQPGKFGVYTSVGFFESWIQERVPNVSFADLPSAEPTGGAKVPAPVASTEQQLEAFVGNNAPTAEPSELAQLTVDVLPGEKIKVGALMTVRITSSVPGHLFVFNQETDGKVYQIFPNKFSGQNLPGQARSKVDAGQTVWVPGKMDRFQLRMAEPLGTNRVVAIVLPPEARVDDLEQKHDNMETFDSIDQLVQAFAEREVSTRRVVIEEAVPKKRAVGVREYEVVP
jgi:secreted trypsin-like serine protease